MRLRRTRSQNKNVPTALMEPDSSSGVGYKDVNVNLHCSRYITANMHLTVADASAVHVNEREQIMTTFKHSSRRYQSLINVGPVNTLNLVQLRFCWYRLKFNTFLCVEHNISSRRALKHIMHSHQSPQCSSCHCRVQKRAIWCNKWLVWKLSYKLSSPTVPVATIQK